MFTYSEEDVLAYVTGLMADPAERAAIEQARKVDPRVRRMFALLTDDEPEEVSPAIREAAEELADQWMEEMFPGSKPVSSGEVKLIDRGFQSVRYLERPVAFGTGDPEPPRWDPVALPSIIFNREDQTATLTYLATKTPSAVALVIPVIDKVKQAPVLVAFSTLGTEANAIRQAEMTWNELRVPRGKSPEAPYVVFATEDNRGEFSVEQLRHLRDRCNGDSELARVVEDVLKRLHGETV